MILKNMNNLEINNTKESIKVEIEVLNDKHAKSVYKTPSLHRLGTIVKKTAGGGGDYADAFTPSPFDVS